MAKQLIHKASQQNPSINPKDLTIDFSFFTAGSGGAGATLLVATFLILAEKALTVRNGRRIPVQVRIIRQCCTFVTFCRIMNHSALSNKKCLNILISNPFYAFQGNARL